MFSIYLQHINGFFGGSWPLVCETNNELTVSHIGKNNSYNNNNNKGEKERKRRRKEKKRINNKKKKNRSGREAVQTVPFFGSYSVQRCAFDPSFDQQFYFAIVTYESFILVYKNRVREQEVVASF